MLKMESKKVDFNSLTLLLKASSKQQVNELCKEAFLWRNLDFPNHSIKHAADLLGIEYQESLKLLSSLKSLVQLVLFHGHSTSEEVAALFPEGFHKNLKDLIVKIFIENLPQWRSDTVSNSVSLPRIVDFQWRVDLKMASSKVARMSTPTCILHLKIQDPTKSAEKSDNITALSVELSKETLDTILHGLGRICDQLSVVAKK